MYFKLLKLFLLEIEWYDFLWNGFVYWIEYVRYLGECVDLGVCRSNIFNYN